MGSILQPGFVYWDGFKYILTPGTGSVGPQGPAGPPGAPGASGNAVLVFRPGGVSSGNVYNTWTALWAARTQSAQTIETPMTIVIDDSIQSPAIPENAALGHSYDLKRNTALVGYRNGADVGPVGMAPGGSTVLTPPVFQLPATFILLNSSYFEWLVMYGEDTVGNIQMGTPYTTLDFVARDCHFVGDQGFLFATPGGTMNFYGGFLSDGNSTSFSFSLVNGGTTVWNWNLYDSSFFNGGTVTVNGPGSGTLNVNLYDGNTQWLESVELTTNYTGGYTFGNWHSGSGTATPGQVLTMVSTTGSPPTATWQTPSGAGLTALFNTTTTVGTAGGIKTINLIGAHGASASAGGTEADYVLGDTVQLNGSNIAGQPFTTLNFQSPLTATNAGSGVVNVGSSAGFTAGGDLTGTSTSQQVVNLTGTGTNTYTGSGTIIDVVPTETILGSATTTHVDSFVQNTSLAGTSAFQNLLAFAVTSGSVDAAISVIGVDNASATGVYRADITFTAIASGGSLNTIVQPTNPQNVRSNGTLTGITMQVNSSGNNVQVQVNVSNTITVKWSLIAQLQWRQ